MILFGLKCHFRYHLSLGQMLLGRDPKLDMGRMWYRYI